MPQEKRRSINYRSFVICDDPRGVVECKALRKSNIISPQKREQPDNKIAEEKRQQSANKSLNALIEEEKKLEIGEGIARELFRNALEVPESKAMLNRPEKRGFGYLQKPNYSSRNSSCDMKNVVRESLVRQCVISNPVFEHNFEHRKHLGSPDMPSSSSSRSSMIHSSYFGPSDYSSISSTSSSSQRNKGKNSNLVYKLMGIESFPSSPVRNRQILNLSKPVYDIDSPRARKSQFGASELGLKQRSIHEIIETMKVKGLLTSKSNVVMKPVTYPSRDLKETNLPKFQKEKEVTKLDSSMAKTSVNVNQKTRRKQETVKKVSEVMKVNSSRVKREENTKLTSSTIKKQKDGTLISKNRNFCHQKTTSNTILDCKTSKRSKNRQPILMGQNQTRKCVGEKNGDVYENKKVNAAHRLIVENFLPEKKVEACCVSEYNIEQKNSLSGLQEHMPTGSHKVGNERDYNQPELPQVTLVTPNAKLKALILSLPSFVSRAEDLLYIQLNRNSVPPLVSEEEPDLAYPKLLLDCANEVMDLRTLKHSQTFPISYRANPHNALSLDRLVDEICNGIEDLKGYIRPSAEVLFSNTLSSLVERDLRFKSGTWEIGWRNAFSQAEVEQVIGDTDKIILGILIEEILVDFI